MNLKKLIGSEIKVIVDRPLFSHHEEHSETVYKLNYGYISEIPAPDGEPQDAYILGVRYPLKEFSGKVIAVIVRKNDIEDKLVVCPSNMNFTNDEILEQTNFMEQYFDIEIIR